MRFLSELMRATAEAVVVATVVAARVCGTWQCVRFHSVLVGARRYGSHARRFGGCSGAAAGNASSPRPSNCIATRVSVRVCALIALAPVCSEHHGEVDSRSDRKCEHDARDLDDTGQELTAQAA